MIKELKWDSKLFDKKIGELIVKSKYIKQLSNTIKKADRDGFKYIICKLKNQETSIIRELESLGFYLSDIGVIWEFKIDNFSFRNRNINNTLKITKTIKRATENDIPILKKMITSLFLESRFYNDFFFTREEADKLYRAWIENSVKGSVVDIVYFIPGIGFVTCKKVPKSKGEIKLIGVKKNYRGKGIGRVLLITALNWFKKQGISTVSARTQLKNITAMNFYAKSGFLIKEYDLIFSKII